MPGLRISAISFLNTAPLMWDFEHGDAGKDFSIEYTLPSACAAALAANQADIGIIPTFTYAEIPGLVILPNIAIASSAYSPLHLPAMGPTYGVYYDKQTAPTQITRVAARGSATMTCWR